MATRIGSWVSWELDPELGDLVLGCGIVVVQITQLSRTEAARSIILLCGLRVPILALLPLASRSLFMLFSLPRTLYPSQHDSPGSLLLSFD